MGELGEPLEPISRELGLVETVLGQVQVPQGGQVEERRVEAGDLQPTSAEVEAGHAAVVDGAAAAAGDALPGTAVGAGAPRREGACGIVGGGD